MESAVFALIGLLIAFTFSDAASRFEQRKALIVEEANDIGTAELRLDLLPADAQPPLRQLFSRYVALRIAMYRESATLEEFDAGFRAMQPLQAEIWRQAVAGGSRPDAKPAANQLLLPALNAMFDVTMTRGLMLVTHTPPIVYLVLWVSVALGAVLAGLAIAASGGRSRVHVVSFALIMAIALHVMIDFEYPRLGLVRIAGFEATVWEAAGRSVR